MILVNRETRVLVQGITGREGQFHTQQMLSYGTKIVAGVTPGKGGTEVLGVPVYDTVKEAVARHEVDASIVFVPAPMAADAALEAAHAGIPLVVLITEGIPTLDMVRAVEEVRALGSRLIGGNCPGIISAEETKIGIMPGHVFKRGKVGLISRSGTLTYEAAAALSQAGLGTTTTVGIGGDPVIGTTFKDLLPLFNEDPETEAVVLIGEIGGLGRGGGRGLGEGAYEEARGGLHRRALRPQGEAHGPRWGHHHGQRGHPGVQAPGLRRGGHPRGRHH